MEIKQCTYLEAFEGPAATPWLSEHGSETGEGLTRNGGTLPARAQILSALR